MYPLIPVWNWSVGRNADRAWDTPVLAADSRDFCLELSDALDYIHVPSCEGRLHDTDFRRLGYP